MPPATELEALVARARRGDGQALEQVVAAIKDEVYNLALRRLWHPADAEDATQEILIRVVTTWRASAARAPSARGCTGSPRMPCCGHGAAGWSGRR